jgi:gamma-butyrobetaine dioxygenase
VHRASLTDVRTAAGWAEVRWSDGVTDEVPAIWLRDACGCPACRDEASGQHLIDVRALAAAPFTAALGTDGVDVVFGSGADEHRGFVSEETLAARRSPGRRVRCVWGAGHDQHVVARATTADDPVGAVADLARYGIALVSGVPCRPGEVTRYADRLGFVRETNYGRLFDVIAEPDPINLAYTPRGLALHTDNPYRDPVPTLQLLHCLHAAPEGGASRFADGFLAAERLRTSDPEAFAVLTDAEVLFRFRSEDVHLEARSPIIQVGRDGAVTAIRVNHRSMEPPDLPSVRLEGFYDAYRRFAELLDDPANAVEITLRPGDLVLFDNRRVLHGRSAFRVTDRRHLQGCYADMDAIESAARQAP